MDINQNEPLPQARRKKQSQWKDIRGRFSRNKPAMAGLIVVILLIFIAIFAEQISPYQNGINQNAQRRLERPSREHLLGTDEFGRDVFTRVIHGTRISLTLGVGVTLLSFLIGGFLGAATGYYGGFVDNLIMRVCDVLMCIPSLLLILALVAALGTSLANMLIALTVSSVPGYIRFVRSLILTVAGSNYVEAAKSYAASDFRIIVKYIVPNAIGPIIVNVMMSVAGMVLLGASLSYLGMGIQPPAPEWGAMLSGSRQYINQAPYLLYFPGLAILIASLSLNLMGDGLRDALDPRQKD